MDRRDSLKALGLAAAAVVSAPLTGCAREEDLVVSVHPWVGYETLYLARELGWLAQGVRLHEVSTLAQSLAALRSGAAAGACMTLDELLRARAAGLPLSAALVFDVSAGADVVLAQPEIRTLGDLAHRRIGYDPAALGALVFEKLLEAAGIPASAVVQVDLPPDRQLEAWRQRSVDVVITYEPLATAIRREGAFTLFDSRQMPDTIIDVLAIRRDRPEVVSRVRSLVGSHFRALEHLRTNEQDALYRISAREQVSPEEAGMMLASVNHPSLAANRSYLAGRDSGLVKAARELSRLLVRRGLLVREDDLTDLILPGTLPSQEP